ncbi:hypothetical protein A374_05176 [Fictibacillus macauensis ZFHKF-1]|uniref:Uncharacterized protein n=1 Tax=Fictibacillus macauensis ZFHKF-1 TaxID=1196324 RepID=I8AL47_9BACL|nr:SEC-C metal-binding domain-containing protein [Fictibacillus macauensis]EIT86329.1 hypothetical protein A374_05176 [Fictibacillus macauensis ZFHKF-1]
MGKIGRNEPCPCGSGKKYKNCCDTAFTTRTLKKFVKISTHQADLIKFAFDRHQDAIGEKTRNALQSITVTQEQMQSVANVLVCNEVLNGTTDEGITPIEQYVKTVDTSEDAEIVKVVASWKNTAPTILKVKGYVNGYTAQCENVHTNEMMTLSLGNRTKPAVDSFVLGFPIFAGEHYEFYIDFLTIDRQLTEIESVLPLHASNFTQALGTLLGQSPSSQTDVADVNEQEDDVLSLVGQHLTQQGFEKAAAFWSVWSKEHQPTIRKAEPYAAALHYKIAKDELGEHVTQSACATLYGISASSLSTKYRAFKA